MGAGGGGGGAQVGTLKGMRSGYNRRAGSMVRCLVLRQNCCDAKRILFGSHDCWLKGQQTCNQIACLSWMPHCLTVVAVNSVQTLKDHRPQSPLWRVTAGHHSDSGSSPERRDVNSPPEKSREKLKNRRGPYDQINRGKGKGGTAGGGRGGGGGKAPLRAHRAVSDSALYLGSSPEPPRSRGFTSSHTSSAGSSSHSQHSFHDSDSDAPPPAALSMLNPGARLSRRPELSPSPSPSGPFLELRTLQKGRTPPPTAPASWLPPKYPASDGS
jgi:hypothetical protein